MMWKALHICICRFPAIILCRSSQALSGWMGTIGGQTFSGFSRDVWLGSSPGSGWPSRDHSVVHKPVFLPSPRFWMHRIRFSLSISLFYCMMLSPPCFAIGMVLCTWWAVPPDMTIGNEVNQTRESCFSHYERVF